MWFFQRIRFRIIVGAILLVAAVLSIRLYIQNWYIEEFRKRAYVELIDETNLRAREISSELQTLGEGVVGLVNVPSVRAFQWRTQLCRKLAPRLASEMDWTQQEIDQEVENERRKVEKDFETFLASHPHYLRVEYYFVNSGSPGGDRLVFRDQNGLAGDMPVLRDPDLLSRLHKNPTTVCYSRVQTWEAPDPSTRKTVLQVGFPVNLAISKNPPGFVVVTLDLEPLVQSLTRSPRYLVFLAGEDKRLLLYPRNDRAASTILTPEQSADPECQQFSADWFTDDKDLDSDRNFNAAFPVYYRYKPGSPPEGRGDDNWEAPPGLHFRLLRIQISEDIRNNAPKRNELKKAIQEYLDANPQLVGNKEIHAETSEILIRSSKKDDQLLEAIRSHLTRKFGSGIHFLEWSPLSCTRFVRSLYKFNLGPEQGSTDNKCFYVALAVPLEEIEGKIDTRYINWAVVGCILGAIGFAVLGSFLLTRPLNAITRATRELAKGKTDVYLPVKDSTEIGVLARSFAYMIVQIQERQQEISEREARLNTILESAADAILTVGEDGTIRSFNKAAEKLFGYSALEIIGEHLGRILDDPTLVADDAEAVERLGERLGTGSLGESVGRRKDGSTFPLEYGGNRVPLPNRIVLTLILRDITDRKNAEEVARRRREELEQRVKERTHELELANRDLAKATAAKDLFLATVSHELRTPLNHVIGFIQLLEMTELDDTQLRDLGKIHHAAHNLLALVNDLLDYQTIIQGKLKFEPAEFDLASWAEQVADAMRSRFAENGNRLVVDCPADLGTLHADEKRVQQALTNLLNNAAKFTHHGVVTLSVRREQEEAGTWIRIDVRDSGRGMTPEQQTSLFQPFTKLLKRSENPEGTGLGLAISQQLCRLMGGYLRLTQSVPGQGSTFTIRLPGAPSGTPASLGSAQATRPATRNGEPAPTRKPTTILVIDDDPDVRELMRRHLEGQGFVIQTAESGVAGLEMVKRLRPDAITLDVLMPGIDGWGTLAALKADAETATIPVILITMLDDRTRGFALGAWEFLPKPIDWSRLIDLLRHLEPTTGPVLLLVDDDPQLRELASRLLSQHGWDVCCVADGQAALDAAGQRRPALVLLDLLMPCMDGFEFLTAFRQDSTWRDVPVVVLTAKDLTEDDRRRLNGSVQKILSKGMGSLNDLLSEVEWFLTNHANKARPAVVNHGRV